MILDSLEAKRTKKRKYKKELSALQRKYKLLDQLYQKKEQENETLEKRMVAMKRALQKVPGACRRVERIKKPKPLRADGTVDSDAETQYSERSVYDPPENLERLEETLGTHGFVKCLDHEEYGRMLESVGVLPDFNSTLGMTREEARA